MKPIAPLDVALHNRRELYIVAPYLLEEMIEFEGMVYIEIVDYGKCIPFHTILIEHVYALHHFVESGLIGGCASVFVVEFLWSIDAHAHQESVGSEELAPLWCNQCAIGLYAVVDMASAGIDTLQFEGFLIESDGLHECLAAVPRKEHVW